MASRFKQIDGSDGIDTLLATCYLLLLRAAYLRIDEISGRSPVHMSGDGLPTAHREQAISLLILATAYCLL